jgi:hypothetical protein
VRMAHPVRPSGSGIITRLAVGVLVVLALWLVVGAVVGFVFTIVRTLLFLGLIALVAWIVLIGPPGGRHS